MHVVIWSAMAAGPGKLMLSNPPACFAARFWRTASDTGDGALAAVAGEQMLVASIFYPPAGSNNLSVPVHDAPSLPPSLDYGYAHQFGNLKFRCLRV